MLLTLSMNPNGSFVVRGDRQTYRDEMSLHGGRWNRLNGNPGWLFPKHQYELVQKFVEQTNIDYVQYYPSAVIMMGLYLLGGLSVFATQLASVCWREKC